MDYRFEASRKEVSTFTNQEIRDNFLIEKIFHADQIQLTYTIYDRMIIGGAMPVLNTLHLPNPEKLRANFFLERRELGVINVGGKGTVTADGESFTIDKLGAVQLNYYQLSIDVLDALYFSDIQGKGRARIVFALTYVSKKSGVHPREIVKRVMHNMIKWMEPRSTEEAKRVIVNCYNFGLTSKNRILEN